MNACFSGTASACILFPSSQAACMVTAFARPMPLYRHNVSRLWRLSAEILSPQSDRMRRMRATADSSALPEPISMAMSSDFDNAAAPSFVSFSRGRSSLSHLFMASFVIYRSFC